MANTTNVTFVELPCNQVNGINASLRCLFVEGSRDCHNDIGYIQYTRFMYCAFGPDGSTGAVCLGMLLLLVLFLALGVTANDFLCPNLFVISKTLRMSQNVAGVTLLAFGNGSPDIFSAIAGIKQGRPELVVGGLIGGGVFVTTVVVGSIFLIQTFKMMERPFIRDVIFYIGAAAWCFGLFITGSINAYHAIGFIALYALYIAIVVVSRMIHQKQVKAVCQRQQASKEPTSLQFQGIKVEKEYPEDMFVVPKAFRYIDLELFHEPPDYPPTQIEISTIEAQTDTTAAKKRESQVSTLSLKQNSRTSLVHQEKPGKHPLKPEPGQWEEFFKKILPINLDDWHKMIWWVRVLEISKAPIVFILTLTVPVIDYKSKKNNWSRILNTLHCITGPVLAIIVSGNAFTQIGGRFPILGVVALVSTALAVLVYATSSHSESPRYLEVCAYLGFIVAAVWIYVIATEIVCLLQSIGLVFDLSDTILGLTILAWGNCLLDFLSNLAVARKGFPRMGISACFGAPFLTLMLGVGVPTVIELFGDSSKGQSMEVKYTPLTSILFATLAISLISSVTAMFICRFRTRRLYGGYLIALYIVFLVTAIIVETGVI